MTRGVSDRCGSAWRSLPGQPGGHAGRWPRSTPHARARRRRRALRGPAPRARQAAAARAHRAAARPGSPFLELSPLAGWGTDDPLGGGLVTGIGVVGGVECVVIANDPTVKGGALDPTAVAKGLRAMEVARANRLPLISLTESAGADLPRQAEIFVPGGATFRNLTRLSAAGVPTVTMVFGSSTAGGAYVPGMSDYTCSCRTRPASTSADRRW